IEITEGVALIRLERFGVAFSRFEVDTPNAAAVLEQDGFYRINVRGEEESEIIVRRGSMEVTTADGSFRVRQGSRLLVNTGASGRLELVADASFDNWDQWSNDRDTTIDTVTSSSSSSVSYLNIIETTFNCFYGASELSSYGHWINDNSYGSCWVPRVSSGWAPYRHGQWLWAPRVGWTWLASEPWGWAPYHYGRWAFLPGAGWAWVPGFRSGSYFYRHSYYQWRPALVYFFNYQTPRGNYIGWYPLHPGERWRRPDRDRRSRDHSHLQYPTARGGNRRADDDESRWRRPRVRDGMTVMPVDGFTRPDRASARPAAPARDINNWIDRGARAGLPDVTPANEAAAPVWRNSENRPRPARAFAPPADVVNRPVVTRNRPADPGVATSAPRERRLVQPRKDRTIMEIPAPGINRHNHGGDQDPSNRPAGSRDNDRDSRADRQRDSGGVRPAPVTPRPGTDSSPEQKDRDRKNVDRDASENPKNRSRERFIPIPAPRGGGAEAEKPRESAEPSRERRARPRDDSGSNTANRPRDGDAAPPSRKAEPRGQKPEARTQNPGGRRQKPE
ncbi:MAG TPA: DUF6600 domain-containing protein, partial [Blastocatellia bacterium]|nr:DUF6600 domain-containing protein [Blastocatellia bacterium]